MIKVTSGAAFLATGVETQTSHKVELMAVTYQSYLEVEDVNGVQTPVGYINSWISDEKLNNIFGNFKKQKDTDFTGNILSELTDNYIADLKELNPTLTFLNTL